MPSPDKFIFVFSSACDDSGLPVAGGKETQGSGDYKFFQEKRGREGGGGGILKSGYIANDFVVRYV